jgi:hypothetical protein
LSKDTFWEDRSLDLIRTIVCRPCNQPTKKKETVKKAEYSEYNNNNIIKQRINSKQQTTKKMTLQRSILAAASSWPGDGCHIMFKPPLDEYKSRGQQRVMVGRGENDWSVLLPAPTDSSLPRGDPVFPRSSSSSFAATAAAAVVGDP